MSTFKNFISIKETCNEYIENSQMKFNTYARLVKNGTVIWSVFIYFSVFSKVFS